MDGELMALRIVHIVLGVFWAGTAFFVVSYLVPALRATWPEGGRVFQRLAARRFHVAIPIIGLLTILAGLRLYMRNMAANPAWMHSPAGMCYGLGGAASILALILGAVTVRPAALGIEKAMDAAATATGDVERNARLADAHAAAGRFGVAVRWVSLLLGITTVLMAIARYA